MSTKREQSRSVKSNVKKVFEGGKVELKQILDLHEYDFMSCTTTGWAVVVPIPVIFVPRARPRICWGMKGFLGFGNGFKLKFEFMRIIQNVGVVFFPVLSPSLPTTPLGLTEIAQHYFLNMLTAIESPFHSGVILEHHDPSSQLLSNKDDATTTNRYESLLGLKLVVSPLLLRWSLSGLFICMKWYEYCEEVVRKWGTLIILTDFQNWKKKKHVFNIRKSLQSRR